MGSPFTPGYYSEFDLIAMGFGSVGTNVRIAKNCTIAGFRYINIGDNVRIDGYTTIIATSGLEVNIGSYIHIGAYCLLSAGGGIDLEDFVGLSQGVKIYTRTDDYGGDFLTNPMVPSEYTGVIEGKVKLGKHVIIGSGTVILPGVSIEEGSSVGAQSLVNKSLPSWGVYFGSPCKKLKDRSKKLLELEQKFLGNLQIA
jgi:acetyltransferase-like isoleucine patch superfamily enzyme